MNKFVKPTQNRKQDYLLLTGATGLLGNYLLRDLLQQNLQVAVVVRNNETVSAAQRVEAILRRWEEECGCSLPRPKVLAGDVCLPNFGFNSQQIGWVKSNCSRILHSAAVLQFNCFSHQEEPWRTNLRGTKNALELARQCEIKDFQYVSTAYVSGKRTERVFETDLDCGQEFRNEYEKSKFAAEKLIRQAEHLDSVTVYRPAVIVGDSKTGFTTSFHGLFLYLRLIATLVPTQQRNENGKIETPIRLPMDGDEPRNLVPVDWVSQVITKLLSCPDSKGQTFHLAPDHYVTARNVIEYCYEYFNSCGVEFVGPQAERVANSDFAAKFFENSSIYQSYETSDPLFDTSNLKKYASDIVCPIIDKEMVHRFIEFGRSNRWGKKRKKVPAIKLDKRVNLSLSELPTG